MLESIKRYSEEKYYKKEELWEEFDASTANVVWEEIIQYRRIFQYPLHLISSKHYITLCRHVMFSMMHCEQELHLYVERSKKTSKHETTSNVWGMLQLRYEHLQYDGLYEWIKEACMALHLDVETVISILQSDTPFLLRICICFYYDQELRISLLHLLLIKEQRLEIFSFIQDYCEENIPYMSKQEDTTYEFLSFLAFMELKLSEGMVSLKRPFNLLQCNNNIDELKECFPQLSLTQLTFYMAHREHQHYYTIVQFMECCNVCYETARTAMDMFVSLHWYQKRKLGKKFVYFVC